MCYIGRGRCPHYIGEDDVKRGKRSIVPPLTPDATPQDPKFCGLLLVHLRLCVKRSDGGGLGQVW